MLFLVLAVFGSIAVAVFATQNTGAVLLNFGPYTVPDIPTYLTVLVPLMIGLVVAFLVYTAKSLSQRLTISELTRETKKLADELAEITKKAHKLELENAKLKSEHGEPTDENSI